MPGRRRTYERSWWGICVVVFLLAGAACSRGPDPRAEAEAKRIIDEVCLAESPTQQTSATTSPVGASSDPMARDVRLEPGDPVGSLVADSPAGTVFVFAPGVYEGVSVQPKADQVFIGEPGAVLSGEGAEYAFRSAEANVTIEGFLIEGYTPGSKDGAIHGEQGARDWTIIDNEIRNNAEVGVRGVSGWQVTGNVISHNGRYGVTLAGGDVVVVGNEIACNSTEHGATGDSGGTKFVHTQGLILRDNHVHHNYGNGLWVDINNVNALIEWNRLISNERAGIYLEISCGGTIRNNTVENNGVSNRLPDWMAESSGIQVANTPNVQVYGNRLSGNAMGIGALQVNHENLGAVDKCDPELRNLKVYDNVITQSGGAAAGLDANNNQGSVWSSWGNTFEGNTYELSNGARFRWEGNWISHNAWTELGNS
jgi:parallel beta-helix repeat protein